MKNLIVAASLGAAIFASAAQAAPVNLNFEAEANGNERGVADGYVLNNANTGGIAVTLSAGLQSGPGDAFAYFDSGNAGLGVCKILTTAAQCNPGNDDNVTSNEFVTLAFDVTMILSDFVFRAANHSLISHTSLDTLLVGVNGGALAETTFGALSNIPLFGVDSLTLAYGGSSPNQFYLSSVKAEADPNIVGQVPLPAGLPLMLAGLGALAVAKRRKQSR